MSAVFDIQFAGSGGGLIPQKPCDAPPVLLVAMGAAGRDGAAPDILRIAPVAMSGGRGVYVDGAGLARIAEPLAMLDAIATVGVTVGAVGAGAMATVRIGGELTDSSWLWAQGPIWLGSGGVLTQVPPSVGATIVMGVSTGTSSMRVAPQIIVRA